MADYKVEGGAVYLAGTKIGTVKEVNLTLVTYALALLPLTDRLDIEFGQHPPRIFHDGP